MSKTYYVVNEQCRVPKEAFQAPKGIRLHLPRKDGMQVAPEGSVVDPGKVGDSRLDKLMAVGAIVRSSTDPIREAELIEKAAAQAEREAK